MENGNKKGKLNIRNIKHWQLIRLFLVAYDVVTLALAYFLALWLRFDLSFSKIDQEYLNAYIRFLPVYLVISIAVYFVFKLYHSIWRFASYMELLRVIAATFVSAALHIAGISLIFKRMPVSYYLVGIMLQFVFTLGVRFAYRFILLLRSRKRDKHQDKSVMIIGAGEAGLMIAREVRRADESDESAKCFIDDCPNKKGRYIDGIPVVGDRTCIMESVKKYGINKIYLAMPSATAEQKRDILNICKETGCELRQLPQLYAKAGVQVTLNDMKEVAIEDLLGREPVKVDMEAILSNIRGKVCLITGGGGSIGSELARQIASHSPKKLILFDVYENNVYDVQLELRDKYPDLDLEVLIGSVRDSRKLLHMFDKYRPEIVYHAAAHKHVPLMEDSPCEAIKNNSLGTYKTAYAAAAFGCKKFVLISTDKAVNPVNIMGASKRLCEMVVQSFDKMVKLGRCAEIAKPGIHVDNNPEFKKKVEEGLRSAVTEFVAVRFGNVLGSNGSVIPIFKKQIAAGGPVTVTHPDIIRYFMTIPEAVSLVLQTSVYAEGGDICVLDMGEPVKIDTLARNLIRLSGHTPDVDIKVVYSGLRPGEKLYEERLMDEEGLKQTPNKMISVARPMEIDIEKFFKQVYELEDAAFEREDEIRELVADIVGTYTYEK